MQPDPDCEHLKAPKIIVSEHATPKPVLVVCACHTAEFSAWLGFVYVRILQPMIVFHLMGGKVCPTELLASPVVRLMI